jgi:CRP-like cAMP-binding protein
MRGISPSRGVLAGGMQLDDIAAILLSADFFEICDADQRRLLAFASERRTHSRGSEICKAGDIPEGAHILISGVLSTTPEGSTKSFEIRRPGSLIGAVSLILAKPRPLSVRAVTSSETLLVPRAAFLKLAHQSPDLAGRAADRIREELGNYLGSIGTLLSRDDLKH